jgi:hypothetical protein
LDMASLPLENGISDAREVLVTCSSLRLFGTGQSLLKQHPHVAGSPEYEIASEVECCGYIVHISIVFLASSPVIFSGAVIRASGETSA